MEWKWICTCRKSPIRRRSISRLRRKENIKSKQVGMDNMEIVGYKLSLFRVGPDLNFTTILLVGSFHEISFPQWKKASSKAFSMVLLPGFPSWISAWLSMTDLIIRSILPRWPLKWQDQWHSSMPWNLLNAPFLNLSLSLIHIS